MRILITGSRGLIGSRLQSHLQAASHFVVTYDVLDGQDILDPASLRTAAQGCDAVIHCAALLGEPGESHERIMEVNLQGTWNVLTAAVEAGVQRLVFLSSVDALGVFKGEREPDYLPLDADHPCYPTTPYGISKHLAEEMCRHVAASTDLSILSLRPPGVWAEGTYDWIQDRRAERPSFEWSPFWEYGAFIDLRDLTSACEKALACPIEGYRCLHVTSSDVTTSGRTSPELAAFVLPDVEWRGGQEYERDPYRSLIDIEPIQVLLDWKPRHTWRRFIGAS